MVARVHGRADDEGFEFVDRRGARRLGASAGGFQRSQRLAAAPGAWNGEVWASENLPRRPAGVEGVGLGAVAGGRGARVAELDHLLAGRAEVRARSGPVAARALHGPGPRLARRVAVRPRHEPLIAPAGRLERLGRQLAARGGLHQRRRYLVSYRDADVRPVVDARVDVFSALYPDDALDDDSECVFRLVRDETPSHSTCEIDIGDQLTDDEGNVEFTPVSDSDPISTSCTAGAAPYVFSTAQGSEGRTFWAWVGELGDDVDEDSDLVELERVDRPVGTAGPDYLRVSGGLPGGDELAKMGETVTFTAQLHSDTGVNGRDGRSLIDDAAAGPDRSGNAYVLTVEKYWLTRQAEGDVITDSDAETEAGTATMGLFSEAPGDWDYANIFGTVVETAPEARFQTPIDTIVWPNADGEFSINLTNVDYQAGRNNIDVGVRFSLMPFPFDTDFVDSNLLGDIVVEAKTNYVGAMPNAFGQWTGHVIFSDDSSDPHAVEASVMGESTWYRIISGSRTGNAVTVSVVDQYGDAMRNVAIGLTSSLDVAVPTEDTPPDQVVYPEEVDRTVQTREDYNGNGTLGETDEVDPMGPFVGRIDPASIPDNSGAETTEQVTGVRTTRRMAFMVDPADPTMLLPVPTDDTQGTFRTRSNGAYRIGYNYVRPSLAQTEAITPQSLQVNEVAITKTGVGGRDDVPPATLAPNTEGDFALVDDMIPSDAPTRVLTVAEVGDAVYVYWADVGNSSASLVGDAATEPVLVEILVADVGSRIIVVNEGEDAADNPQAYFYDENDTFIVDSRGATLETFEEALGLTSRANGVYPDMVSWENYTLVRDTGPNRPAQVGRTIWEIELTCAESGPTHPRTGEPTN